MDMQFDELTGLMEGEVRRQVRKLELCRSQYQAIRANDFEYVEAKAADINALNRESSDAELRRAAVAASLARRCGLGQGGDVFQDLVLTAPECYRNRLRASESRIHAVQHEIRTVVMGGIGCLQNAASAIVQAMEAFKGCVQLVPEAVMPGSEAAARAKAGSLAA